MTTETVADGLAVRCGRLCDGGKKASSCLDERVEMTSGVVKVDLDVVI